ncbi:MAG TPA: PAS domain-containing sensor histidine kinase, partial [Thermoanaerobaculia bacterium]
NRRVEEILGHPIIDSPNIEAYSLWIGFHPDGRRVQGHEWPLARAVQGETIRAEDYLYQRGDGRKVWIRIHGAPVRDETGQIAGGIVALYDIDEQRRMQDENTRLYQEAWAANRAKDDFLATLSHELRTPMTAIIGWARILRDEATENPIVREAAEAIGSSAQLQAQLVDDLLDVSRIANGKIALDRKPTDVNEVIAGAITAAQIAAETQGVRLVPTLGTVAPIEADRGRLRQVIGNLLSNAIKFTPKGGLVEIRSSESEGCVEISVRDTGRGIAPRLLPHIFERLRQASDGEAGGLGLGLTIVRRLTELHGGEVHVESEGEGKGATFVVKLPALAVR